MVDRGASLRNFFQVLIPMFLVCPLIPSKRLSLCNLLRYSFHISNPFPRHASGNISTVVIKMKFRKRHLGMFIVGILD